MNIELNSLLLITYLYITYVLHMLMRFIVYLEKSVINYLKFLDKLALRKDDSLLEIVMQKTQI